MLKPQERRLSVLLKILALVFGLAVLGYLLPVLGGPLQSFYVNLPFVTNSVVKIGVLALLAFFASADVRKYRLLVVLVIVGHILSELATACVLLWGNTTDPVRGLDVPITTVLVGSMVLDGLIIILLVWFFRSAEKAWYDLKYLSPMQFRSLTAIAEIVIAGEGKVLKAKDVARNVDKYLASFRARTKWQMKLVLSGMQIYPLFSFKPPLSYINAEDRLAFVRKRFYQDVSMRLVPPFWRMIAQVMIRISKQLSYLGYYNDPRTFASVGYTPFTKREDTPRRLKENPPPERSPLYVRTSSDIVGDEVEGDVVIIGSGAAASVLAQQVVKSGRTVLMLERGDFVDPSQFSEDEVDMLSRLYADGALQLSSNFRFQVLQGSCVGGTTVVNNAVCFDPPAEVIDRWNDPSTLDAGVDDKRLFQSLTEVRSFVGVERQDHHNLNKGAKFFSEGIARLKLQQSPNKVDVVEANIHGCLGCGYCNIGCAYGKKLSMLDTVLPGIQKTHGRDALTIIAGCEAEKLKGNGKTITSVVCRFRDGRRIDVRGKTIVVAAGAVSSSILLLRSGIGGKKTGKHLSFNMGSPITAVFKEPVRSYDGLQISHYLRLSPSLGYITETWFNPPVAQALTMPGWFEDHYNNMQRYDRISCTGVLVGTESNGEVRRAGLTGREVKYDPTPADLDKLLSGLMLSGEVFLEAGAECIIPNTFEYHECHSKGDLQNIREWVRDSSDITLGTGHPQGGNIMSRNPQLGVVNDEFRVYGYNNLFVCDASVFPSSIGVNPQLTVMALAHYAAPFVAQQRNNN